MEQHLFTEVERLAITNGENLTVFRHKIDKTTQAETITMHEPNANFIRRGGKHSISKYHYFLTPAGSKKDLIIRKRDSEPRDYDLLIPREEFIRTLNYLRTLKW